MKPCIIIPLMKTLFRLFVISLGILSLCFFACSNSTISEIIDGYWYDIDSGEVIYINGKEGIRAYYDSPSFEQSMYSTFILSASTSSFSSLRSFAGGYACFHLIGQNMV